MGRDMFEHIRDPLQPVVIVQVTAGDGGRHEWYWKARQNGAIQSVVRATAGWSPLDIPVVAAVDANAVHEISPHGAGAFAAEPLPCGYTVRHDVAVIAGRQLLRCVVTGTGAAPTTLYFLHLADGAVDGAGFERNQNESLARLFAADAGHAMTAKWAPAGFAPAVYRSWDDLLAVLHAVVREEVCDWDDMRPVWVHSTVDDETNEGDHSDHRLTSRAVRDMNERYLSGRLKIARCYTYVTKSWPATRYETQRALVYAYAAGFVSSLGGIYGWNAIWDKEYAWFGGREFWQVGVARAPEPPCRPARERGCRQTGFGSLPS